MGCHAGHLACEGPLSLMRNDDFHARRLADDAHFRPHLEFADLFDQPAHTDTPHLFVI